MPLKSPGPSAAPAAVQAYASRIGLGSDAFRSDGCLSLSVDDRYRVQLRPAEGGRITLASTLLDLGTLAPAMADDTLMRLATWGAGLLQEHASTLALDAGAQRLVVQQLLPAATDAATLEIELADFVNVLAFWTRTAAAPARSLPASAGA